ncbi:MAG: hypothetical protein M1812_005144 [Candelaria pacifica]|nr:MAG: hypothetical protein M1812_005144 [Candelaria pacifica]
MSSNRKMTDFFKPFAEPRGKRPLTIDIAEDATAFPPTSRSATSRAEQSTRERPHMAKVVSREQGQGSETPKLTKTASCGSESAMDGGFKSFQNSSSDSVGPLSSQPLSNTSSQRVIKHGEVVVTNSDDEDSDSSLDDIDSLLTLRKPALSPPSAVEASRSALKGQPKRKETMQNGLWQSSKSRSNPFTPVPAVPKYKFSLDSLVSRTEKDAASEAEVFKARALMCDPAITKEQDSNDAMEVDSKAAAANHAVNVDQGLLASVIKEETEGGGMHNVLHAMKRTEVGNREKAWYFLDEKDMLGSTHRSPFPHSSAPSKDWRKLLSESASREQTFLSGAAGEMLAMDSLPDEIIQWIIDELCIERRDDLRSSYLLALQSATDQITTLLTPLRIDEMLSNLGARREALDPHQVATPGQQEIDGWRQLHGPPWANLGTVIKALTGVAENLSPSSREHAILLLFRMLLDSSLTDNGDLLFFIEDALESLTDSIPSNETESSLRRISITILASVINSQLRLQLLSHFPASTCPLHLLRRRLALAIFFSDLSYLSKPASTLLQIPLITQRLFTPAFNIDNDTDYPELATMAAVLDIAIDDGLSTNMVTDKEAIETFNTDIDALTARIKVLFTSILDSGASHMTRTEAKEALERLHYRLVYTVRTKPVAKKRIFGDVKMESSAGKVEENDVGKGILARFLAKQQSLKTDTYEK